MLGRCGIGNDRKCVGSRAMSGFGLENDDAVGRESDAGECLAFLSTPANGALAVDEFERNLGICNNLQCDMDLGKPVGQV